MLQNWVAFWICTLALFWISSKILLMVATKKASWSQFRYSKQHQKHVFQFPIRVTKREAINFSATTVSTLTWFNFRHSSMWPENSAKSHQLKNVESNLRRTQNCGRWGRQLVIWATQMKPLLTSSSKALYGVSFVSYRWFLSKRRFVMREN